MSVLFVTGAGTDIGKTYVTALLTRQLRATARAVLALKPVASGAPPIGHPDFGDTDTARLLDAQGLPCSPANVETCTPWRFTAPLSPDMAAAADGRTIELAALLAWCRTKIAGAASDATVLIEGVGGVMSPMTTDALNLDVMKALGCPAILVGGSYLGAISHVLTALEVLKVCRVPVMALVINETAGSTVPLRETVACIQKYAVGALTVTLTRNADTLPRGALFFHGEHERDSA